MAIFSGLLVVLFFLVIGAFAFQYLLKGEN